MLYLNKKLETSEERLAFIEDLLTKYTPNEIELEQIADYLTYPLDKEERIKEREILTKNRMVTINKHETSYQTLSTKFEAGADAVEALSQSRSVEKEKITHPKAPITQRDLNLIPGLRDRIESAQFWNAKRKRSEGKTAQVAYKAFREDMALAYEMRDCYYGISQSSSPPAQAPLPQEYPVKEWIDPDGTIHYEGASLMKKGLCAELLKSYIKLKGQNWGKFNDMWFLIMDFENCLFDALEPFPVYQAIVEQKWSSMSNNDIVQELYAEFGKHYTPEQVSSLYCNKIPELIASKATDNFIDYWYTHEEKGTYKTCSCCGRVLVAHPRFFNRNSTSKDGFYSQCKECRSKNRRRKK